MRTESVRCALLLVVFAAACSSSNASDAGTPPEPCGDAAACLDDQLCVSHQDCTAMTCTPVPSGGMCPAGTTATSSCPDGGAAGCLGGCNVSYGCQARPTECATLSCACAANLCAPDTCLATMGTRVACSAQ